MATSALKVVNGIELAAIDGGVIVESNSSTKEAPLGGGDWGRCVRTGSSDAPSPGPYSDG